MHSMLRIGIVGYGKMGQMIESIAIERGHSIAFIAKNSDDAWMEADVIIEFSRPESAIANIRKALDHGIPAVVGTTGWLTQLDTIRREVIQKNASLLYASNFSIGVNLCFELNERMAKLMSNQDYTLSIEETHHTEKLDSPSGTAISLAQGAIQHHALYSDWKNSASEEEGLIPILSHRESGVPGTHIVRWENDIDQIELTHEAKNRRGFAQGAVVAAEWLINRKGIYTMRDVLNNSI